jgi:hypothetical protein
MHNVQTERSLSKTRMRRCDQDRGAVDEQVVYDRSGQSIGCVMDKGLERDARFALRVSHWQMIAARSDVRSLVIVRS